VSKARPDTERVDRRLALLARAAARCLLVEEGALDLDDALNPEFAAEFAAFANARRLA
jgi:hypothetical protein